MAGSHEQSGEPTQGWKEIEHGSDVGLQIEAPTLDGLFQNAACGMINLLMNAASVVPDTIRHIAADGCDREALLAAWLEEILFLHETGNAALHSANRVRIRDGYVSGAILCEKFDPGRHETGYGIKAVTWHDLNIVEQDGVFRVRVIFDV